MIAVRRPCYHSGMATKTEILAALSDLKIERDRLYMALIKITEVEDIEEARTIAMVALNPFYNQAIM